MSKFLQQLLDAEEPIFSLALRQLEQASGRPGTDARLVGDILAKAHESMRSIGLDPADTTGEELYRGLLARIETDNKRVAGIIGAKSTDDVHELVPLMINVANKVTFNRKVFVLKHAKAKELLRHMPPRQLMQRLGYTDIEALFKNEDFDELYTALRFSEGGEWLTNYNELFKTVTAKDYEERDIRILQMNHEKYVDLAEHFTQKKLHNVTHTKELGVIVVVPLRQTHSKGLVLKTLPLLLHYLNEVKLYSNFFKLKSKKPDFGKIVVETLIADPAKASQMAGHYVHWRVIQRYFGKLKDENHREDFEPHVHPEDLHWRRAETLLREIDPEIAFWQERDYVGLLFDGQALSFNFVDVALSYANDMAYQDRYVYHFRESLWNEVFMRYMSHANLESQILEQLDNDMVAPEKLKVEEKA